MELPLDQVDRYLRENRELQRALDIAPELAGELHAEPLGQGEHNANLVFSHPQTQIRYVLRINFSSQMGFADQIGYEYRALELLAPTGATPRPLYVDPSKRFQGHGVLVMEFCPGEHLDFGEPADLAWAARLLADVHSLVPADDCSLVHPDDPLKAQFDECLGFVRTYRASDLVDPLVDRYLDRMLARARELLGTPFDPADTRHVLNTEAVPSHFIITADKRQGRFLDWEKPILGEVAQDVAYFLSPTTTIWDTDFIFDAEGREAFLGRYWQAVDGRFEPGSFWRRFPAYVAMNCLRGITWSCQAWVEYHDPARPLKNQKTWDLLRVYLSEEYLDQVFKLCF
ncbi:MAG: aminoglycoside phosphotransferase family protein [Coriobacteriales bacterium]|nr:aminoglycoside phosphotransferase family protein [Coriobacteriales bacterium]